MILCHDSVSYILCVSSLKEKKQSQNLKPKPLTVWITTNWKILKEMGISDHLTCLLRNLYAGQETTVRTRHGTTDWFQIGKGVHQVYILSPFLLNFYAECIIPNARTSHLGSQPTVQTPLLGSSSWNQDCGEKYQ